MIRVGESVDVEFRSSIGEIFGRCRVVTSKRWTLELQSIDLPVQPGEDRMVRIITRTSSYTATVQRSDRTSFEILRPADLQQLPPDGV